MPHKVPRTKAGKSRKIHTVMSEFKRGQLKSGTGRRGKKGGRVKSRKQAIAIALKMAGKSKSRRSRRRR